MCILSSYQWRALEYSGRGVYVHDFICTSMTLSARPVPGTLSVPYHFCTCAHRVAWSRNTIGSKPLRRMRQLFSMAFLFFFKFVSHWRQRKALWWTLYDILMHFHFRCFSLFCYSLLQKQNTYNLTIKGKENSTYPHLACIDVLINAILTCHSILGSEKRKRCTPWGF